SQLGSSLSLGDSSSAPSESVKCVDLLGVKLHPDSAELICSVFREVRSSARRSFSRAMLNYISTIMISELSALEKAIWAKTYRKLYLSRFMSRLICVYHSRCYTNFIRALGSIRVLSSSSDRSLVTLSGVGLLGFLSRLDCAVRGEVEIVFNSEWGEVTGKVFSELEDESMSTVSCEDFIRVLDIVGVPVVALSVSQRYGKMRKRKRRKRAISKMKKLRSGNECAVEVTEPGSSSTTTTAVDKEVDAERGRGRFYAQKSAVALDCASLCAMVFPECALMIEGLFSKVDALARSIYEDMVSKQLPQEISDKLSVTERAIWYRTYKATCEVSFVSRCFGEYHTKHRPDFVRSISKIQVLSDARGNLLDFLLCLDCTIRREMESVFSSCWSEVSVSLEDESLSAISCRDFVRVLDVAGIPAVALSARVRVSTKGRGGKGKSAVSVTSVIDLTHSSPPSPRSLPSQSGGSQLGSSLPLGETSSALTELTLLSSSVGDSVGESSSGLIVAKRHKGSDSVPVSTYSEAGTVCTTAVGVLPVSTKASTSTASAVSISSSCASLSVQYVDLLGVRLHPDSAKLICNLFSVIRRSAKTSYSMALKRLLRAVSSELSAVEQAIWCRTYRELHLLSFMARCLCLYHHGYRPDFIRSLAGIRVLSSSSDRNVVPLSGAELLSFLSKLDCAIREEVESIFSLEWDRVADSVFAELEDGSLSDVDCKDLINIFDAVSVPVVAFSISQEYEKKRVINKSSKKSGSGACSLDASLQQVRPKSKSKTKQKSKPKSSLLLVQRESLPKHHLLSGTRLGSLLLLEEDSSQSSLKFVKSLCYRESGTRLGSLLLLEEDSSQSSLKFVKSLYYRDRDQSGNVSAAVSTFVALPGGAAGSSFPLITDPVAVSTVSCESFSNEGDGVFVSTEKGASLDLGEGELPASSPVPEPVVASDISLSLPPSAEELISVGVVSALSGSGDDLLSPHSSSPSIVSSSLSLSSSPSESGLDADVSFSSTESLVLTREVGLASEVIVSESGVLVGESTPASSSEQLIVPITTAPSSVSAALWESSAAAGSSSSAYFRGPKKSFIMQSVKRSFEVPMSSAVSSSSASVGVASVPQVAAATDSEDVGERLAALLNHGLPPSPPPASEFSGSMRGGRGRVRVPSSHRGNAQRGSGRKRKSKS
ncbi:hypothetical protein, partial [Candidatus Ichthyocystis sparus]|uniref:hypothetical protein n=1 Tax=Candidatus Ichthyocystis sparus TaxID=1561004 RepID=UPI00159EDA66